MWLQKPRYTLDTQNFLEPFWSWGIQETHFLKCQVVLFPYQFFVRKQGMRRHECKLVREWTSWKPELWLNKDLAFWVTASPHRWLGCPQGTSHLESSGSALVTCGHFWETSLTQAWSPAFSHITYPLPSLQWSLLNLIFHLVVFCFLGSFVYSFSQHFFLSWAHNILGVRET